MKKEKNHNRLISKIYKILKSGDWIIKFKKSKQNIGHVVDEKNHTIYIDQNVDILSDIVHECLHIIDMNDKKKEREISRTETSLMKNLAPIQAKRLLILSALIVR